MCNSTIGFGSTKSYTMIVTHFRRSYTMLFIGTLTNWNDNLSDNNKNENNNNY